MNNQDIIIAKSLEIAVSLTKADHTWLRMDERGFVFLKEPLFTTLKTVIRITGATDDIINLGGVCNIFPEG